MELERVVGSIIREGGPQPFVLDVKTGKLEVGKHARPDEAQGKLSIIHQQRFAQLVHERANVSYAQVRVGQYFCTRCGRWTEATPQQWSISVCMSCSLDRASDLADHYAEMEEASVETPGPEIDEAVDLPAPLEEVEKLDEDGSTSPADVVDEEEPIQEDLEVVEEPAHLLEEQTQEMAEAIASFESEEVEQEEEIVVEAEVVLEEQEDVVDALVSLDEQEEQSHAEEDEAAVEQDEVQAEAVESEVVLEEGSVPTDEEAAFTEEDEVAVEYDLGEEADVEVEAPLEEESVLTDEDDVLAEDSFDSVEVDLMSLLERAIAIAVDAHQGQFDKAGAPYILHPLRMMMRLETPSEKIVAVLHDVIEDTPWTFDALRSEGFPKEVIEAIAGVTRRGDETYEAFIDRAAGNPLARAVKLADLEDNMDVRRLEALNAKDQMRLSRYLKSWQKLKDA